MRRKVLILAAIVLLSVLPETDAHDYSEIKAGRWREAAGSRQCEDEGDSVGRNYDLASRPPDEYRFSQSGDRVVVTLLESGRPRLTVLGEVSEEYIHFEVSEGYVHLRLLESIVPAAAVGVWSVEILEDEDELEYTYWKTAYYANNLLIECDGLWFGGACSGKEYIVGTPSSSEDYRRYSVECTGTLEWTGD